MRYNGILIWFAQILAILLSACATSPPHTPETGTFNESRSQKSLLVERGPEAAVQLNGWYNRTDLNCGNPDRPSFQCSGVMLRATETNPAFLPWDPSPGSIQSGGVSFSWLRMDNNFSSLVFNYSNGFIFYPALDTPPGKDDNIAVLCAFPMDADTFNRNTLQGCGSNTAYPLESRPCEEQGITTAQQWISHFNQGANKYRYQCGWNVRAGQQDTANRFYQNILARQAMSQQWWAIQNELRLATWPTGYGANLPIQSFFYQVGKSGALANARNDQMRYYENYGQVIPIIRLTLPSTVNDKATFAYSEADQGIGEPLTLDTSPAHLQGVAIVTSTLPPSPDTDASMQRRAFGGNPPYRYRSSNSSIAYVDSITGKVTSFGNGSATITVRDQSGQEKSYPLSISNVFIIIKSGRFAQFSPCLSILSGMGARLPSLSEWEKFYFSYDRRLQISSNYAWTATPTKIPGTHWAFVPDIGYLEAYISDGPNQVSAECIGIKLK
ncbi:bacterial Ig-like domain family protein [Burkholderia thailandensis MSMB121]|uniref:Ig-like domain-containing protein n=2 Tax=Burkholderia humptydooensis TaxID=430531 RepID=UPI00032809F3|nr:Ig-like domain-containing protein [Burkholderia humptydooensis]AGK51619.1 bacterial Ig-like domain family protein [Burkholderia thailandensis MSMB121]ATF32295.1 hypothetical protein CO709_01900 [Burkholderia thailandensis]